MTAEELGFIGVLVILIALATLIIRIIVIGATYVGRTYMDAPGIDGYIFIKSGEALMSGDFAEAVVTGSDEYDLIGELYEEHESAE